MRRDLFVLSNRQPFRHDHVLQSSSIQISRPVSGMVSALEPMVRARGATWIAQGAGTADYEVLDPQSEVVSPHEEAAYRLRRVFLSQNEIQGHTDGFSNQGLWPLCHLAFQKPQFSDFDWRAYQGVNQRFASMLAPNELADHTRILVQDFHLALVPAEIRKRVRGDAPRIGLFWHIPWPPEEVFLRCPWAKEILEGMLGSNLIAFHTPRDRINFLRTCEQLLTAPEDCKIRWKGQETRVMNLPVAIPLEKYYTLEWENRFTLRNQLLQVKTPQLMLSVDRIDYTKGCLERLGAFETLLEKNPELVRQLTWIQVANPCRDSIGAYRELQATLIETTERLNRRWPRGDQPIIRLIHQTLNWNELSTLYQLADVCVVTPLHDGMNLVAKEFVWCQHHCQGALILSPFAGASQELGEGSWSVHPSHQEQFADTIREALESSEPERKQRMQILRKAVFSRSAQNWGDELLQELGSP